MSTIRLIQVPYDSGQVNWRMGRGPRYLSEKGVAARVREHVDEATEAEVRFKPSHPSEISTVFELQRAVAGEVREAVESGHFPLLLSGVCHASVGAIAGLGEPVALVWFDAHGDLNTPETTLSGFFDGMALAMVSGYGWNALLHSIPNYRSTPESRIILVGAHDLDEAEQAHLTSSNIEHLTCEIIKEETTAKALAPLVIQRSKEVRGVYVHLDLDVHDASFGRINPYQPAKGGLTPGEVHDCLQAIAAEAHILGAAVTAYDPVSDTDDRGADLALDAIALIAELIANG